MEYEKLAKDLAENMSPEIVEAGQNALGGGLQALYEQAKATPNSWDDLGVRALAKILRVDLVEPEAQADPAPPAEASPGEAAPPAE